jgi:hypothetical protein
MHPVRCNGKSHEQADMGNYGKTHALCRNIYESPSAFSVVDATPLCYSPFEGVSKLKEGHLVW